MPGLLDMFANPEATAQLGAGLLAGNLGAGTTGYFQALAAQKEKAMKQQMLDAQMRQMALQDQTAQMQLAELKRKMVDADEVRATVKDSYASRGLPQSAMGSTPMGPLPSVGAAPDPVGGAFPAQQSAGPAVAPKSQAWAQYQAIAERLAAKGQVDAAQQYFTLAEKFRPKYSTTPQMMRDPQTGKLVNVLVGEDGTTQTLGFGVKPDMQILNLGGIEKAVDKNALNGGETFNRTMTPGEIASNQVAWANNATTRRGQDMTDSRARDFNSVQVEANNIKRAEKQEVADMTKNSQIASFDTMLGTLDRLKDHAGLSNSVGLASKFPTMPGSNSANFQAELNTFQSQAFIPMVAQLKGMGALSDAEGKKLTAAVGALDPRMGETAFRQSVARIRDDMEAARARVAGSPRAQPSEKTANLVDTLPKTAPRGARARDIATGQIMVFNGMSWVKEK